MKDKAKEFEKGWEDFQAEKKKQIEEMAKIMCKGCIEHMNMVCRFASKDMPCNFANYFAKALYEHGYRKIDKDSVVVNKAKYKELKQEYKFLCENYKDLHYSTKKKIEELEIKLKQASKETVEKYNDKLVAIVQHLFDIGQIDFKAKIELLIENEKILKQFGVEIKE